MILDLSNVLSEQHSTIEESVPIEMTSFQSEAGTFPIIWKSPLALCIEYAGDQELKRKVCLDPENVERMEELDETNYIDGYNFDVDQLVYNELLVGWPTKILCSEDCKGICNVCGQNLNEGTCNCEDTGLDPRMSVIRDLFKNFKEV